MPISPWGIVTDMLLVPAVKISNPIKGFVQMKIDDRARDAYRLCLRGLHLRSTTLILRSSCGRATGQLPADALNLSSL
jgi:hypothetical protein